MRRHIRNVGKMGKGMHRKLMNKTKSKEGSEKERAASGGNTSPALWRWFREQ